MQNHDWIELFRLIPAEQHNTLVLTTLSGVDLSVDVIIRSELNYVVFRGRVCGNTDEGRVFFLPYRQIDFLQINRQVKEAEVRELFGSPEEEQPGYGAESGSPMSAQGTYTTITAQSGQFPPVGAGAGNGPPPSIPPQPAPARGAPPGVAARLSNPPTTAAPAPSIVSRLTNVPTAALHPQTATRLPNVPTAALIPPGASISGGHGSGEQPPSSPPRNSILERLRAQRNSILPPRPPTSR
jgi:hypothetical protein